jgi:OOP family OmpA-OmpF porin
MKYLTEKGIDASRMSATGFGQDNPIAPNNTKEGRALNRRVELILIF